MSTPLTSITNFDLNPITLPNSIGGNIISAGATVIIDVDFITATSVLSQTPLINKIAIKSVQQSTNQTIIAGIKKSLINATPTSIVRVDMTRVPDGTFSCKLFYAVEATDNVDFQVREGDVNAAVVKKGVLYTTAQAAVNTGALSAGTLAVTFSWLTAGTDAYLQINATTSLSPVNLYIMYLVLYSTHPAFTYI